MSQIRTSPTRFGLVPAAVTDVGGVVLDIVGQNGTRVVAQLSASSLHEGFFSTSPGTIGTLAGLDQTLVNALGGGLSEVAVRLTVFDGDTQSGNFDFRENWLDLNGVRIESFSDVETYRTDSNGGNVSGPRKGFGNQTLDTGWFYNDDPATMTALFAELEAAVAAGDGLAVQLVDTDPGDNFFDFTQGIDGGLIDIGSRNVIPVANDDSVAFTEDALPGAIDVRANDTDTDPFRVTDLNGTAMPATVTLASGATLTVDADGNVLFTQNGAYDDLRAGESAVEVITYTVTDTQNASDGATLTITVTGVNDAPEARDDAFETDEDALEITGNLFADNGAGADSDADAGASFSVTAVDGRAGDVGREIALGSGLLTVTSDGTMTFRLNGGYEALPDGGRATERFTYTVTDDDGLTATATATVVILGRNDPAQAADDDAQTLSNATVTFDPRANDVDPEALPLSYVTIAGQSLVVGATTTLSSGATVTRNADGTLLYDPNGAFAPAKDARVLDSFGYIVADSAGAETSATVTVAVIGPNTPPVATDDTASVAEDGRVTIAVLGNDADDDASDTLTASLDTGPANGTVTANGDGTFAYVPRADFNGTDSFTYAITDGSARDTATVTVTVHAEPDAPTAVADSVATTLDTAITIDALGNDFDVDGDSLSLVGVGPADDGIVTIDGATITYTPLSGFFGPDSFVYTIADTTGREATARVDVTVAPGPQPNVVVSGAALPTGDSGSFAQAVWTLANTGTARLTDTVLEPLWLSTDTVLDASDTLLRTLSFSGDLDAGESIGRTARVTLPDAPGTYHLIVTADGDDTIAETDETDNDDVSAPLEVLPDYFATVTAVPGAAVSGERFTVSGQAVDAATGDGEAYEFVTVDVVTDGIRRSFDAFTDGTGHFSIDVTTLPGTAGLTAISARHPGVPGEDPAPEAVVPIYGMDFAANRLSGTVLEGGSLQASVRLDNLSDLDLTGLTARIDGLADGVTAQIVGALPDTLDGDGSITVVLDIAAEVGTVANRDSFTLDVSSAEGANSRATVTVDILDLLPRLAVTDGDLVTGMLLGDQTLVTVEITNLGGAVAEDIEVLLPPGLDLLSLVTRSIPDLDPGESADITFSLTPDADQPAAQFEGSLVVSSVGASVNVPFQFTNVSGATGNLDVALVSERTFLTEEGLRVDDATVTVRDYFTNALIRSASGVEGTVSFDDLPAGFYRVEARADGHDSAFATVEVLAGQTVELQSFMSEQTVSYSWSVEEIAVEDRYVVEIESTFTTNVPQPVVVLDPPVIDVFQLDTVGEEMTVALTVTNHGLITAENLNLDLGSHPWYRIEPLIDGLDELAAKSSVTIPVRIVRIGDEDTATAGAEGPADGLLPASAMAAPSAALGNLIPCIINGLLSYEFPCGGFTVGKALGISYANVDGTCSLPFTLGPGTPLSGTGTGTIGPGTPVFSYVPATSVTDLCDLLRAVFDCAALLPLPPKVAAALTLADFLLFGTGLEPDGATQVAAAPSDASPLAARGIKRGIDALDDIDDLLDQVIPFLDTASQAGACAKAVGDFLGNETLSDIGQGVQDVADAINEPLGAINDIVDPLDDLLEGDNPFTEPDDAAPAVGGPQGAGAPYSPAFEAAFLDAKAAYRAFLEMGAGLSDPSAALASTDAIRTLRDALQDLIETGELDPAKADALQDAIGTLRDMLFGLDPLDGLIADTLAATAELELLTDLGDVFLGAEVWADHLGDARVQGFLHDFFDFMRASFDEPTLLTPAQRDDLLARDLPDGITRGDVEDLFDLWFDRLTEAGTGDTTSRVYQDGRELQRLLGEIEAAEQTALEAGFASLEASIDARLSTADDAANAIDSLGAGEACAQVRLRIEQDVALTRQGFLGTLAIDNLAPDPLTEIEVVLEIRDADGTRVAQDVFGVFDPVLDGITAIDGTGALAAGAEGSVQFTILPSRLAAPTGPTAYTIGGTLSYTENGVTMVADLSPEPVTVLPQPELRLDYFQSRDVFADDPFTPEVEDSVPFSLGVRVSNVGPGAATDLSITSAQPEIIDNEKGLLVDFEIIGTEVNGTAISPTLLADFGDLRAGETALAVWKLQSSLQGVFSDYSASFEHVNGLGIEELSLITDVTIRELVQVVEAGSPAVDDGLPDFLVNDVADAASLPDRVYFSEGGDAPVVIGIGSVLGSVDGSTAVSVEGAGGWTYTRLPDPLPDGRIAGVWRVEENGAGDEVLTALSTDNVWRTDRTFPETGVPVYEDVLHIFDHMAEAGRTEYRIALANVAPEFVSDATAYAIEGQDAPFLVAEAEDADGQAVTYALAGPDAFLFEIDADSGALNLADGVSFASLGITDGDVRATQREVEIAASDGSATTTQTVTVTLLRDTDGDGIQDVGYGAVAGDNAIEAPNTGQADANGDGYGDVIDFDLDDDGTIGFADFGVFLGVFGTAAGDSPIAAASDFDGDGTVGMGDYTALVDGFGEVMAGKSWIDLPLA